MVRKMKNQTTQAEQGQSIYVYFEVPTSEEINERGDLSKIKARKIDDSEDVTFYLEGEMEDKGKLILQLCKELVDAGYFGFNVSYEVNRSTPEEFIDLETHFLN